MARRRHRPVGSRAAHHDSSLRARAPRRPAKVLVDRNRGSHGRPPPPPATSHRDDASATCEPWLRAEDPFHGTRVGERPDVGWEPRESGEVAKSLPYLERLRPTATVKVEKDAKGGRQRLGFHGGLPMSPVNSPNVSDTIPSSHIFPVWCLESK